MRKRQRRESARDWARSGAKVTVKTYAKRHGVDCHSAYDDLTAIGCPQPDSAARWARRPPATPHRTVQEAAGGGVEDLHGEWWLVLDGRPFFAAGHTPGGAPYGVFEDEVETREESFGATPYGGSR